MVMKMHNIKYFDTHAHLHDPRYETSEWGSTDGMINTAVEGGLAYAVNIGTNLEDAKKAIAFAEKYPFIYAAVGMYPSEAQYAGDELDAHLYEIEKMLSHPKVVALGEIGLDYHYEDTDKAVQQYAFDAQMQIFMDKNILDFIRYETVWYAVGHLMRRLTEEFKKAEQLGE